MTELDGKEIARKDLTSKKAEDTAGYIHRSTRYFWLESGDTTGHPTEEVTINGIYDKEGNLLTSE